MKLKPPREKSVSFFKNKKFLTSLIGIFIILIMVLSALDLWKGGGESYVYQGTKFSKEDTGWSAYIGANKVTLAYNPKELENIVDAGFSNLNSVQKIYVSTDNPLAMYRSMDYFKNRMPLSPVKSMACVPEAINVSECEQFPLKDCNDANDNTGVVIFKRAENTTIQPISRSCFLVEGNNEDLVKVIDKSMLKMLGV